MGIYAYRHRRPNSWNEIKGIEGGPGFEYPKGMPPIAPSPEPKTTAVRPVPPSGRLFSSLPYPSNKFTTSPLSPYFVQAPPSSEEQAQYAGYPARGSVQPVVLRPNFVSVTPPSSTSVPGQRQNTLHVPENRQDISSADIDQILDLATMYSPSTDSPASKPLTPESPHTPYSPYSHIMVTPMSATTPKSRPHASFPISPMPSMIGFGDSRESGPQGIEPASVIMARAWDEDQLNHARKSSGAFKTPPSFLAPERPAPAVTRYENGYLGVNSSATGAGRGRGLP